jgi:hypothetical protein
VLACSALFCSVFHDWLRTLLLVDIAGACDRSAFSSADILADNNIVEFAKVGSDDFQLNVKDTLTPFQSIGIALSSICAHK